MQAETMSASDIKHRCYEAELLHQMAQNWVNAEWAVRVHNGAMKIIHSEAY